MLNDDSYNAPEKLSLLNNKYSILCKSSLTWYVHKHFRGRLVLDEITVSFIVFLICPSTLYHSLMYSRTVFNHSLKYSIVIILLSQVLSYTHSLFSSTQSCSIYWSTQSHSLSFLKDSIMLSFFKFSVTLLSNALNHTHSLFSSNQSHSLFSITLILIQYSILYSVYLL